MMFWSGLGFVFRKFPFVGWTRGWYADDTENNLNTMKGSQQMHRYYENHMWGTGDVKTSEGKSIR